MCRIICVALVISVLMFYMIALTFYTIALILIKKKKKQIIGVALGLLVVVLTIMGISLANHI